MSKVTLLRMPIEDFKTTNSNYSETIISNKNWVLQSVLKFNPFGTVYEADLLWTQLQGQDWGQGRG